MKHEAKSWITNDHATRILQIEPDGVGDWGVRYLWINHRTDNDEFMANYFNKGNQIGHNIRKQTASLGSVWSNHNQMFDENAANGNLVWRVKAGNEYSKTIDYIEIWRSIKIIDEIFNGTPILENGNIWTENEKNDLDMGIWDAGFEVRHLYPSMTISKNLAIEYYWNFVDRWKKGHKCIINTKWNKELNPGSC